MTPTSGVQNGCHGNAGCLASWPRILQFMAAYFKKAEVYKLTNRHTYSTLPTSRDSILGEIGQKSRSYIIYAA